MLPQYGTCRFLNVAARSLYTPRFPIYKEPPSVWRHHVDIGPVRNPNMSSSTGLKRIALGADHGGFELKETIKAHLTKTGYEVRDCGTNSKEAVDYPMFARGVAEQVSSGQA